MSGKNMREGSMTHAQKSCLKALCQSAGKPFPEGRLSEAEAYKIIEKLTEETGIGTETG